MSRKRYNMKMKELKFSKNVTLKGKNIEAVQTNMMRTRQNFSAALNLIIEDWVKYRVELCILKDKIEQEAYDLKNAEVIKDES